MVKRKIYFKKNLLIWVALAGSVLLNIILLGQSWIGGSKTGVKVIGVIDGDTLVLEGKSKIRLRYVDAPELKFCGGKEAKNILEKLVVGKKVEVRAQIADQYGRGMALVDVAGVNINAQMLRSGWVRYHHDNSDVTDEMKAAFEESKQRSSGLFGVCQSVVPDKKGCAIKGNIDQHGNKIYYLRNCSQYRFTIVEKDMGEAWFCNEKEAQRAGFKKARTC